jgi:transcriptional regulator with XRE-family HTH domain
MKPQNEPLSLIERENPIGTIFEHFPELNVAAIARELGINRSLMQQYVNGSKKPSFERIQDIERYLHRLGDELLKLRIE